METLVHSLRSRGGHYHRSRVTIKNLWPWSECLNSFDCLIVLTNTGLISWSLSQCAVGLYCLHPPESRPRPLYLHIKISACMHHCNCMGTMLKRLDAAFINILLLHSQRCNEVLLKVQIFTTSETRRQHGNNSLYAYHMTLASSPGPLKGRGRKWPGEDASHDLCHAHTAD